MAKLFFVTTFPGKDDHFFRYPNPTGPSRVGPSGRCGSARPRPRGPAGEGPKVAIFLGHVGSSVKAIKSPESIKVAKEATYFFLAIFPSKMIITFFRYVGYLGHLGISINHFSSGHTSPFSF